MFMRGRGAGQKYPVERGGHHMLKTIYQIPPDPLPHKKMNSSLTKEVYKTVLIQCPVIGSQLLKLIDRFKIFLHWLESLEFLTSKANNFWTAVRRSVKHSWPIFQRMVCLLLAGTGSIYGYLSNFIFGKALLCLIRIQHVVIDARLEQHFPHSCWDKSNEIQLLYINARHIRMIKLAVIWTLFPFKYFGLKL